MGKGWLRAEVGAHLKDGENRGAQAAGGCLTEAGGRAGTNKQFSPLPASPSSLPLPGIAKFD